MAMTSEERKLRFIDGFVAAFLAKLDHTSQNFAPPDEWIPSWLPCAKGLAEDAWKSYLKSESGAQS